MASGAPRSSLLVIAVVATDVGAWRVLRPVLRELLQRRVRARALLAEPAASFAAREDIPHVALPQPSFGERVAAVLGAEPTALLLGTSPSEVVERAIVRELRSAAPRTIPTIGVLDAMLFAERRFGPALRDLPDVVACPDAETAERLQRDGAGPERVAVTGNPTLEEIAPRPAQRTWAPRRSSPLGDEPADILFVSQSVARVARLDSPFSIDERTSLIDLLRALGSLESPAGFRVRVRWHPTQRPARLPRPPRNVRIEPDLDPDRLRSVARARVVVGISSTLLTEARMLPRASIAYLPGPHWEREQVYAAAQGVRQAGSAEDLRAALAEALAVEPVSPPVALHAGAARKIADLIVARQASAGAKMGRSPS